MNTPPDTIIILAPVAPFRGGIARHSSSLARALARTPGINLIVESFERLYPRLLYPGLDDRDRNQAALKDLTIRYDLDTLDPLSWRRAVTRISAHRPKLVVIPAWTFFVSPGLAAIARALRRRGIPVVQIVHNIVDHEGVWWKRWLCERQLQAADIYITHGEALADQLRTIAAERPVLICSHPAYADYPPPSTRLRREFSLELLCFGLVRPYKGVDLAIEALGSLRDKDVRLTVAGEVWGDIGEWRSLAADHGVADRVEFIPRYVSDQEAADLFDRADAVLAPYRSMSGSGVAALSAHYRRPVIASDLPGFAEIVVPGRNGWLFPAGNSAALADLIASEVTRERAAALSATMPVSADETGWDEFAAALLNCRRGAEICQ
jgi:Glycosyltransferase